MSTYVFKTVSVPGAAEATWTPASVINAATRVDLVMMNCMAVLADCGCSCRKMDDTRWVEGICMQEISSLIWYLGHGRKKKVIN